MRRAGEGKSHVKKKELKSALKKERLIDVVIILKKLSMELSQ